MKFPEVNRFIYIIGNNGSGKSRALEENAERLSEARNVVVIASGASDKFRFRAQIRRTTKGSYRYLGNRTVGNATHNGTLAANAVILYLEVLKSKLNAEFGEFLKDIDFESKVGISHRKAKGLKTTSFDTQDLTESFTKKYAAVLSAKNRPFEAVFYKDGNAYSFSALSSGEQYIITTALKILASLEDGTCYFIDEPEVSLHVEWQVKWPERFQKLLGLRKRVNAYIATHSPVIISSALKTGAACYTLLNNALKKIVEDEFNVERILVREFNTITPNNKYVFEALASIVTRTVETLNESDKIDNAAGEVLTLINDLKIKLQGTSRTHEDGLFLDRTIEDFDMAIRDLIELQRFEPSVTVDSKAEDEDL